MDDSELPLTQSQAFAGHGKAVACVDVDHSGSRLLSGSRDGSLQIFDFNGMKASLQSFRKLTPSEGYPLLAVSWSPSGDAFLAVSGSTQVKIYDRDGLERGESVRGDMYIRDQRNTKGHIAPATGGQWHPADRGTALTCSEDGTLRLWDTATLAQKTVIKPQLQRAARVSVTACRFNPAGSSIAAGVADGSVQIWDARGGMGRSAAVETVPAPRAQMIGKQDWRYQVGGTKTLIRGAHPEATDITGLALAADGHTLLSRAADDTLKVWDLRKAKAPVHAFEALPNAFSSTAVAFAPDPHIAVTGTSADRGGEGGSVAFFDIQRGAELCRVAMPASVVALHWSRRLNQIFAGTGDRTTGEVRALYSPTRSERGVLLCATRKAVARAQVEFEAQPVIHTPHALPLFREPRGMKRHLDAKPKDASTRFKPDAGPVAIKGSGSGGVVGATGGTLLTQHVLKRQGKLADPRQEDVRSQILRHAAADDQTAKLFTKAYEKTQPEQLFEEPDDKGEAA